MMIKLFSLLQAVVTLACSTVMIDGSKKTVGKNFDWDDGTGMVVVNPRGLEKTALTLARSDTPATWKAKYSSVTFNQYGKELPYGGINEAGLVVEIMWLSESSFPGRQESSLPALNQPQWIQYILDTSPTLAEAEKRAEAVRVTPTLGATVHYLVCDRRGECGAFEYLNKKLVITKTVAGLPIKGLTNSVAKDSLNDLRTRTGFGGNKMIPDYAYGSLDRFAIVHHQARLLARAQDNFASAFEILERVRASDRTKWNIVYDMHSADISFRTAAAKNKKNVKAAMLFRGCDEPALMADMNAAHPGGNLELVAYDKKAAKEILKSNHTFREKPELLEAALAYPERFTKCTE